MAREHQPLVELERTVVFVVIAFEPVLAVDALLGADKAEPEIAEHCAIVGVPSAQHRARDFAGHAADRGTAPDPARRRVADPGLAIALMHVFDMHAADPVGEVVILRGCDGRRQTAEPELFEARQETLLLLAAEYAEDEFGGIGGAAPCHHGQDQAREEGMIEIGDAAPFQPLRLARVLSGGHVRFLVLLATHLVTADAAKQCAWRMQHCLAADPLTRSLLKLRSESV